MTVPSPVQMRIWITGGAGFIGVALAKALAYGAAESCALSLLAIDTLNRTVHPTTARPGDLPDQVALFVADVCDNQTWEEALSGGAPDVIVHLAAETGTGQSLTNASLHSHVNITGTAVMLDALMRHDAMPKRLILASSRAVYGEGQWRDLADGQVFSAAGRPHATLTKGEFQIRAPSGGEAEPMPHLAGRTPPAPSNIYGATKLAQEHIMTCWARATNTPLTILRLQNVYGPGQSPHNPYTGIVGLFHRKAAAGEVIEVYEDGAIGRDFIFIDDVVAAFVKAVHSVDPGVVTFDVGAGRATMISEAASIIAGLYAAPKPQITGAFRDGDVRHAFCDTSGLARHFGLRAQTSFEKGNAALSAWLFEIGVIPKAANAWNMRRSDH